MSDNRMLKAVAGVVASFTILAVTVIVLMVNQVIGFSLAMLMLVALVGLYFGFGVLAGVYRLVGRLK